MCTRRNTKPSTTGTLLGVFGCLFLVLALTTVQGVPRMVLITISIALNLASAVCSGAIIGATRGDHAE